MAKFTFDFEVIDNLDKVREALLDGAKQVVRTAAFAWEAEAKKTLVEGFGVDTGAMRAGISVVTHDGGDLSTNLEEASSLYLRGKGEPWPVGRFPKNKPGPFEAWVISPAAYSVYQEFGTRFMPARRFMSRGQEKARQVLNDELKKLAKEMER